MLIQSKSWNQENKIAWITDFILFYFLFGNIQQKKLHWDPLAKAAHEKLWGLMTWFVSDSIGLLLGYPTTQHCDFIKLHFPCKNKLELNLPK